MIWWIFLPLYSHLYISVVSSDLLTKYFIQGCIFCHYPPPLGGGDFFKIFENTHPRASFFFVYSKNWGSFSRGRGNFFKILTEYTPLILFDTKYSIFTMTQIWPGPREFDCALLLEKKITCYNAWAHLVRLTVYFNTKLAKLTRNWL